MNAPKIIPEKRKFDLNQALSKIIPFIDDPIRDIIERGERFLFDNEEPVDGIEF